MHALHKILLRVDKSETKEEIRHRAEAATEDFCGRAYDWRETETAGRWSGQYPENVILSKDDVECFLKKLNDSLEYQRGEVHYHEERVCEVSSNIHDLVEMSAEKPFCVPAWNLECLASLLYGNYTFDSRFYDVEDYTALITEQTIKKVEEAPDEWALVLFDYHF